MEPLQSKIVLRSLDATLQNPMGTIRRKKRKKRDIMPTDCERR